MKYRKVISSNPNIWGCGYIEVVPPYRKFVKNFTGIAVGAILAFGLFYLIF